ncbi:MAG: pyridoxamine 5'-phosphate oxidase family protein [Gammaproteobacteria bacterium]|nr:pyridoxamine 5'-phosphate oxidase family protein [Gammaproteobacteria bacterium]
MNPAPEETDPRAAIRAMLSEYNTVTLATARDAGPWAAAVFYASDSELNLYFVSDHRTRHGTDLANSDRVAGAINPDCGAWADVRGLQLEGRVEVLTGAARLAGLAHYLAKFHDVKALFEKPQDKNEETIAERLKAANLYRLRPEFIRLIDNSRWFGFKTELQL